MKNYVEEIGQIEIFEKQPFILQRKNLGSKNGKLLASVEEVNQYVGEKKQEAGFSFLERIKEEIFEKLPEWEKKQRLADLDALSRGEDPSAMEDSSVEKKLGKPELNDEYLKSIGREDLIYWPVGKESSSD